MVVSASRVAVDGKDSVVGTPDVMGTGEVEGKDSVVLNGAVTSSNIYSKRYVWLCL